MRTQAVGQALMIVDLSAYLDFCRVNNLSAVLAADVLFEVLALLVREGATLSSAGLKIKTAESDDSDALAVMRALDQQIYTRALAEYERNFRVTQA